MGMAHIFVRVCALVCNVVLPSISLSTAATIVSRGRQGSSLTSASMQPPPSRGMLYGQDRLGRMAYGWNKRIDQRQLQSAGGARAGMQG